MRHDGVLDVSDGCFTAARRKRRLVMDQISPLADRAGELDIRRVGRAIPGVVSCAACAFTQLRPARLAS